MKTKKQPKSRAYHPSPSQVAQCIGLTPETAREAIRVCGGEKQAARQLRVSTATLRSASRGSATTSALLNATIATTAGLAGPSLNRSTSWRPLGEHVTPSRTAVAVTFVTSIVLHYCGHPGYAEAAMSASIGLGAGEVVNAIRARRAGA